MTSVTRTRLLWIAAGLLILGGAAAGVRFWLGGYVVRTVLGMAGATQVRFADVRGTPWHLEVTDLALSVQRQAMTASRVTLVRDRWWQASLGDVRIEGARLTVVLDGSDVNPWKWDTYEQGGVPEDETVLPPFRSVDLAGELVVRMGTVPDMAIAVRLESQPLGGSSWSGRLTAEGPGFHLAGTGSLLRAGQELDFEVQQAALDLAPWSRHIQRLVVLPGGVWEMGGRLTGTGAGKVTARRFAATARFKLGEGRMRAGTQAVAAEGVEAELEFSDLWKLRGRNGALRLDRLRIGRLELREVAADFSVWNGKQLEVGAARFAALGGRVSVEPFRYHLDERMLTATIMPDGVSAARLLDLADAVSPRLGGRLSGTLPLRIHNTGVQVMAGGFLTSAGGGVTELQVMAAELLRSGALMDEATREVFRAAGGQHVVVRVDDLRLEVRPPGLPLGTSATVSVAGRVDGAPVAFTYHVNGMIERYLRIMP